MSATPRAPFDAWLAQVFEPAFGFAWYARPTTLVTQAIAERGTLAAVHALHDLVDSVLAARAGDVGAAGGLLVLHDWRGLRGYEREEGVTRPPAGEPLPGPLTLAPLRPRPWRVRGPRPHNAPPRPRHQPGVAA